jgi:GGDEF domain-containing protein
MKAKTVRNLSAALVFIFIFALFILVGGLVYYYRQGINNAERIFSELFESETDFYLLNENTALPEQLKKSLDTQLSINDNLAALSITIDNNPVYANPVSSQFFAENNDGNALTAPPFLLKTFSTDFTTENGANGVASAAIYILNPAEIFKSARIAFLMILAATLATIILIVYTKLYPDKTSTAPHPDTDTADEPPLSDAESDIEQDEIVPEPIQITPQKSEQIPNEQGEIPPIAFQSDPSSEIVNKPNTGFYSNETGFMRETFIERVLDPMLINAAPHNEDIAFLLISIPGLDRKSETGEEVCKSILEQFKSKERIFEYSSDSFAAILQDSNAEKAVAEASQLYLTLNEKVGALESVPEIHIGIATKAFRTTVAASALLAEAKQAIARAVENPDTPIVAFKINPEKYREFVGNE